MKVTMTEQEKKEIIEQGVNVAFTALYEAFKVAKLDSHISSTIDTRDGQCYYLRFEKVDTK